MPADDFLTSSTAQTPGSDSPLPHAHRSRVRSPWRRRSGSLLVLLAIAVWVATLLFESELGSVRFVEAARVLISGEGDSLSDSLLEPEAPEDTEPLPVAGLLPATADDWIIQGPQPVPGSGGSKVEAYFNPDTESLNLVTPMMAYVQVTRMPGPVDAVVEPAERADSRYTEGRGQTVIAGTTTEVGHTEDLRIYYIGWSEGDLVYTLEATYTHVVPAVRSEALRILRGAAEEVAGLILGEDVNGSDL